MPASELRLRGAGVSLAADVWGDPQDPPLLFLHGGGQTRGAWAEAAQRIAPLGYHVHALDLRGHGESDWSPDGRYSIERFAEDVRAVGASLPAPPVLVGASLGGVCSMLAMGEEPRAPGRALVLVDIAHRPEPVGVTRVLAFMRARPDGFASLEEAGAAVSAYLEHRLPPESLEGLKRNLRQKNGRWIWHWDPRLVDDFSDIEGIPHAGQRFLGAAKTIAAPILLVRGKVSDVLTDEIAREFQQAVPHAEYVDVAGAGHMVAGDRNDRFIDAITPFLRRVRG
jgi:pimeloyl-ACP methyl ester carboxylesterase